MDKMMFPEGTSTQDIERSLKHEERIDKGVCPNNCGIMKKVENGAECSKCGFTLVQMSISPTKTGDRQ